MKVNYCEKDMVKIKDLYPGDTFRTEILNEPYIKVYVEPRLCKDSDCFYAVNLVTGLLEEFAAADKVKKIEAEVNVK